MWCLSVEHAFDFLRMQSRCIKQEFQGDRRLFTFRVFAYAHESERSLVLEENRFFRTDEAEEEFPADFV